jgi:hypothetical protein
MFVLARNPEEQTKLYTEILNEFDTISENVLKNVFVIK